MRKSRKLREKRSVMIERHDKVILQHDNVHQKVAERAETTLKGGNEKSYANRCVGKIFLFPTIGFFLTDANAFECHGRLRKITRKTKKVDTSNGKYFRLYILQLFIQ